MKNSLFLLLIAIVLLISSCATDSVNGELEIILKSGITSKNDFSVLAEENIYPINLLTIDEKNNLVDSFVFENGILVSKVGNSEKNNFTFKEYVSFLQLILGANPVFEIKSGQGLPYPIENYIQKSNYINSSLPNRVVAPEQCPKNWKQGDFSCKDCEGECIK